MYEDRFRSVAAHVFAKAACRAMSSRGAAGLVWRVRGEVRVVTRVDFDPSRDHLSVTWSVEAGERTAAARPVDLLQMDAGDGPIVRWYLVGGGRRIEAIHVQQMLVAWAARPSNPPARLTIDLD